MIRIMFVCTGNICRSPMAELVMKQLVRKEGLDWVISSAANTGDEVGNPVYPPVRALLEARGISCKGKYSVQLRREDYPNYDYFIGMDARNRPRYAAHLRRRPRKQGPSAAGLHGSSA